MSGRLFWHSGRFTANRETDRIFKGIKGWRENWGDSLDYYALSKSTSVSDDIYDEGAGLGREYTGPIKLDCIHVTHIEGENQNQDFGFYYNDNVTATLTYEVFKRAGFASADVNTGSYIQDRLIYDNKVFRVTKILVEGQIQRRDTIVQIEATQVKPDEMVNDPQFKNWSA